jgi:hypothetical protein
MVVLGPRCKRLRGADRGHRAARQTILGASRRYRPQTAVILVGVLAPWLANAVYLLGLGPLPNLDLTPFAFSLSGLALGWGLLRLRLLDAFVGLIPTARDAVVERMRDGVVVLDRHAISSI